MPFNIGPGELILILIIALVVLGPARLPDVAQSLGKSLREFRKAASDISDASKVDVSTEPTTKEMAPPTPAPVPVLGVPVPPVTPEAQIAVPAPSEPVPPAPSEAMTPPSTGAASEATADPATGADRDSTAG
jgi:TatA/E family protein of Tat protein translocase